MDSILCLVLVIVSLCHNVCSSLHHQYGMELVHMVADKPQTIHVDEQQKTIFLACEIKTNAELKWYYNDTEITKNPPPYVLDWNKGTAGEKGSILMIRQPRDGKYDCEAQTSSFLIKATVHIIVKQRHLLPDGFPKIEVHPINVYTRRDSVDFNCCVTGQPPFRFKWYYNRNPIGSDRIHEVSQTVVKDDMFCSNLKVTNVSVSVGFYQCVIMNKIGQVVTKDAKIAFNGDHRRKRREVIDKLKCNSISAPKNITEYPGIVKHTSIHRSCSGSEKMIIRWSEPEYASHVLYYKISIMGEFEEHSRCYLVSKDKLTFDLNKDRRFYANCSYTVVVRTIPELPEISRQALTVQQLYKCPYDGVWSEWSSWSTCICKEKCVGSGVCYTKKTRTKDCLVPSVYNESVRIPGNKARCPAGELHDQSSQDGTCAYTAKTCRSLSSISSQSKSGQGSIDYQGFIIAGIIGTLACTVAIIFIIRRNKGRYLTYQHTVEAKEKPNVYVSYIAGNEKSEDCILNLVASLSNYGINFKMDILCQVEINNNGGLPIWLQDNVLTTDKILVVLTKEYVKALQTEGNDLPNSICKVHSEYKLINNFMYQSCQRTPKVVIMIESGITGDLIPPTYRNLYHCSYPKQYKDTDEAFNTLVGMLLDTEPVQVHIQ